MTILHTLIYLFNQRTFHHRFLYHCYPLLCLLRIMSPILQRLCHHSISQSLQQITPTQSPMTISRNKTYLGRLGLRILLRLPFLSKMPLAIRNHFPHMRDILLVIPLRIFGGILVQDLDDLTATRILIGMGLIAL